jgi:type I restriction enzyme, S subunit
MSGELPVGWVEVPLGEMGDWFGGGTPSKSNPTFWKNGTIPWVSPKDMKRPLIETAEDSITEKAIQGSSTKLVPKDCVLMVVRSGILAHTLPIAINTVPVTLNQDMKALRPHATGPQFVAHGLRAFGPRILDECTKQGTTVASVNTEALHSFGFPLPPLNEQKRIVAKIDVLTEKSREARQALEEVPVLLDQLRQSILAAAFRGDLTKKWREQNPNVEPASVLLERIRRERRRKWEEAELAKFKAKGKAPGDNKWKEKYVEPEPVDTEGLPELPEGWCWASVEEMGATDLGRMRSPAHHFGANERPYLRVKNVYEDRIDITDVMTMHFEVEEFEHYRLRSGDVLLNEGQSRELVGRPAIFRGEIADVGFTNSLIRFRPYADCPAEYALGLFRHYLHCGRFQQIAQITTNIAHLGANRLRTLEYPVPPLPEQEEIARLVRSKMDEFRTRKSIVGDVERDLAQLDASILAKAFRGELVPQDPSDEPASVLLERIREERESGGSAKQPRAKERRKPS